MSIYSTVFNQASIYEMLFLNIKPVLIHSTLDEFKKQNEPLYNQWIKICISKHYDDKKFNEFEIGADYSMPEYLQHLYEENAINYPEFSKIIAISYITFDIENGSPKRVINKIISEDEISILNTIMDVLNQAYVDDRNYKIICGHNIINFDIPFLIKRFLYNKNLMTIKKLPLILKKSLESKPWESSVIDTLIIWKFGNYYDFTSLDLISDFLGLKKTIKIMSNAEINRYYYDNKSNNLDKTLKEIGLQSATQINLTSQLINDLRNI